MVGLPSSEFGGEQVTGGVCRVRGAGKRCWGEKAWVERGGIKAGEGKKDVVITHDPLRVGGPPRLQGKRTGGKENEKEMGEKRESEKECVGHGGVWSHVREGGLAG